MKKYSINFFAKKLLLLLSTVAFTEIFFPNQLLSQNTFTKIDPQNITIVRDSFGIPHIFAKTDAEVAYGLAWANDEDAFSEAQNLVYISKGFMGRKDGVNGARRAPVG